MRRRVPSGNDRGHMSDRASGAYSDNVIDTNRRIHRLPIRFPFPVLSTFERVRKADRGTDNARERNLTYAIGRDFYWSANSARCRSHHEGGVFRVQMIGSRGDEQIVRCSRKHCEAQH